MLKIKELFNKLIDNQKEINNSIKELTETISLNRTKEWYIDNRLKNIIDNVYNKSEIDEIIKKQLNVGKERELLELIEKYLGTTDYKAMSLFKELSNLYNFERRNIDDSKL